MEDQLNPIAVLQADMEQQDGVCGMFRIRSVNDTITDALTRPDPKDLYHDLLHEGEVACLFADGNLGKSIFAVQMAEEIARDYKVLYIDCELSDKQFQRRYADRASGVRHIFPDNLMRADIVPSAFTLNGYEEAVIENIKTAALVTGASIIFVDNLTYLCNASDKGDMAGLLMMRLMNLKKEYGWTLLIIAHTPKRCLSNPITQNDLAGSKKLYNFFDNVFAIGKSAKDNCLRYVKQIKVRAGEYRYDSDNVILYEIDNTDGYLHFEFKGFANEMDHLNTEDENINTDELLVLEHRRIGKTINDIAAATGFSKSKVGRIVKKIDSQIKAENPTSQTVGNEGISQNSQPLGNGKLGNLFNNDKEE